MNAFRVISLWFALSPLCIGAQQVLTDSLRHLIQQSTDPSEQIDWLLDLADEQLGFSIDSSLATGREALSLTQRHDLWEEEGRTRTWIARMLSEKGMQDEALDEGMQAIDIFTAHRDSFYLAKALNAVGIIHKKRNNIEEAIRFQFEAAAMSEAMEMPQMAATSYNSLGNLYAGRRDNAQALEYYQRAVEFLRISDNTRALTGLYINMASIASDPIEERSLYHRARVLGEDHGYHRELAYVYNGLAMTDTGASTLQDSATYYYRLAIDEADKAGDDYMVAYNELYLAILLIDQGSPVEAEQLIRQSRANPFIAGDPLLQAEATYYLGRSLAGQAQWKAAYTMIDSALSMYEAHYDEALMTESQDAAARYEAGKKEAEIVRQQLALEREVHRRRTLIAAAVAGLMVLSLIFFWLYGRTKRRRQASEDALIAERQRTAEFEALTQAKIQFFNNVSHELRTPLSLIVGPLQDALSKVSHVGLKSDLSLALRNSQRLLFLTDEIMDLSKIDAGKLQVDLSRVALKSFLSRVIGAFASLAQVRDIRMVLDLDIADNVVIESDIGKIETILNNLIINAIKYSHAGGVVRVQLDREEVAKDTLKVAVSDQGMGIPPDELPHIFDRFFQSSTTPQHAGTGIGLSLVRELCHLLKGEIQVSSKAGKGSTFWFTIPVSTTLSDIDLNSEASGPIQVSQVKPLHIDGQAARLLIVEDDHDMSKYLHSIFAENYICDIAYNGKEALELLRVNAYDLITSDIMMPEMDGFVFRQKINEDERLRQTPFIMLSARTLEADKLRAFQLGIDDYITKPFNPAEIKARVARLLKNSVNRNEADSVEEPYDLAFLKKAESAVMDRIDDVQFRVADLARSLNYSERHLSRILKKHTGLSTVEFILELRLQKAYRLIKQRRFATVNEVKFEVGIDSSAYFSKKFKERFGVSPSDLGSV